MQLCHFYLPSRDPGYLAELRSAFEESGVALECFLIDDGNLTDPTAGEEQEAWISGWLSVAEQLQAPRARVVAGMHAPTSQLLATSARRLSSLADRHGGTRIVTENWHALLPDATSVNELLDRAGGRIGFLIDLGNWSGPDKYDQLAQVAARAETSQAKCRTDAEGNLQADDYRSALQVLRGVGYAGPLALVYDGNDPDEWAKLEEEYALVCDVFASPVATA
jgi:sugar phosphate isomerase/epimerase